MLDNVTASVQSASPCPSLLYFCVPEVLLSCEKLPQRVLYFINGIMLGIDEETAQKTADAPETIDL